MIFSSKKLDKSDELTDTIKDVKVNDAEYYESNTAKESSVQGYTTLNPEKVTHTSNRNETVTHNRNGNFEAKLFSVVPTMNRGLTIGLCRL